MKRKTINKLFYAFIFATLFFQRMTAEALGATLSVMPILLFMIWIFFQKGCINLANKNFVICTLTFGMITLLYHGVIEAKNVFFYFLTFITLPFIIQKYGFKPKYIYLYYFVVVIPVSIYMYSTVGGTLSYIPDSEGMININAGHSTKHGTAAVGFLLFLASLYNIHAAYKNKEKIKKIDKFFFVLSLYFTIFSTSRSFTLALLATLILYAINRIKVHKVASWILFIVFNLSTYAMETLRNFLPLISRNEILAQFMRAENFDRDEYGVTSGRSWLWAYHMNIFMDSKYLMGGGKKSTDFGVNDFIPSLGIEAHAGSESAFTGMIACYGLIGIAMIVVLIALYKHAIAKKNVMAMCIIFGAIYNTTLGDGQINVLSGTPILIYLLYYYSFTDRRLKLSPS